MNPGIDYADLCLRVLDDELAYSFFEEEFDKMRGLFGRHKLPPSLSPSKAGSCPLSLWSELHGHDHLPENVQTRDSKMEPGIVDGARSQALIKAGIRRWYWPFSTREELEITHDGMTGHTDQVLMLDPDPIEPIEHKLTLYTGAIEPPEHVDKRGEHRKYMIYQCCWYAIALGTETFTVMIHAPATWHPPYRRQFRYFTDEWRAETLAEYARLEPATHTEPPEADPPNEFRCESCRYASERGFPLCERNRNPFKPLEERVEDTLEALV
jgi:hypothetical protein